MQELPEVPELAERTATGGDTKGNAPCYQQLNPSSAQVRGEGKTALAGRRVRRASRLAHGLLLQ